jgi:hypothetical protein
MMQVMDFIRQAVDRTGLGMKSQLKGLPEILDDNFQDTEALIITAPFTQQSETPNRYIALVGAGADSLLKSGVLFASDAHSMEKANVRALELQSNPQSAMGLLMELEHADLILFVLNIHERLCSNHLRWLARMEILKVPRVLLISGAENIKPEVASRLTEALQERLRLPVVLVYANHLDRARTELIKTLFGISPQLAALASLQSSLLRPILAQHLLYHVAYESLALNAKSLNEGDMSPLTKAQIRLVQQLKVVYGKGEQLSRQEYQSMSNMATTAMTYASYLLHTLPSRDPIRRERVTNAISTLLLGYLVIALNGETPPDIRNQVLPQIWRLYRASGQQIARS